ncbi:hypothetical protein M407DRAFT_32381 [Tulasnella calospora MUT 4182]|uniref:PARP-type domain-containing protein n=1 Tax=Tulasnella calospora MUT 4182 TaxID=1051891 RepID=A0A0C3K974_9AGAM|nr:hypothetical protein M407DRAFT_32381 [Tulasnella calospora MUT 4182]
MSYALRYQHEELASCDVLHCKFGHRMVEDSMGLVRIFRKGEGTVNRRWMHLQCVTLRQAELVNQEHPLGKGLEGYSTLTQEQRDQADRTFGLAPELRTRPIWGEPLWDDIPSTWESSKPGDASPFSGIQRQKKPRGLKTSAQNPHLRTNDEPTSGYTHVPKLTEECEGSNSDAESVHQDGELLLRRAYFALWMKRYSERRDSTSRFLIQMAFATDTYEDFYKGLRFPKRRATSNKRYHEATIISLELKLKEADVQVAEAELVLAEATARAETARLEIIEHKMKMVALGFAIQRW